MLLKLLKLFGLDVPAMMDSIKAGLDLRSTRRTVSHEWQCRLP